MPQFSIRLSEIVYWQVVRCLIDYDQRMRSPSRRPRCLIMGLEVGYCKHQAEMDHGAANRFGV